MTTTNALLARIAHAIIHDNDIADPFDTITAMRPLLRPEHYRALALAADICPIHDQDLDSCADDDEPDCADLRR